jgi:FAD/FMN-containing dehydrogenase
MEQPASSTTVSMLDATLIRRLTTSLEGRVILSADVAYESVRRVWNWAVDRHPGMIMRCANRDDVLRAIEFARSNDLLVAVRGGGHSYSGHSTCDGGMVIDLSPMKGIRIDREKRITYAQAGLTTGELDAQTQAVGLATSMGACAATGIAGVTLGGGFCLARRKIRSFVRQRARSRRDQRRR